jgi:hypothetical protein
LSLWSRRRGWVWGVELCWGEGGTGGHMCVFLFCRIGA